MSLAVLATPATLSADSQAAQFGTVRAFSPGMTAPRRFVYIVRSERNLDKHYVGVTSDVPRRLDWHNTGPSGHTVRDRPWALLVAIEFQTEVVAARFEKYLKSGSGRAFATRHFGDLARQMPTPAGPRQPEA